MKERYDAKPDTTDIYVPDQRAWGKSNERIRMVIRALKDLSCHTFVTCLAATDKDERTNKTMYFPSLPGKLKAEVSGFFDIVGFLRVTEEGGEDGDKRLVRKLQVAKTENVIAKDRTARLGNVVSDPSITKMWSMIQGEDNSQT
jgi:hypothetical protein